MGRDPFHQPRVLRAPSNLALSTAREGAATASLGNLGRGLSTLMVKNFFLISNVNLPSFSLELFPLALSLHTLMKSPSPSFLQVPSGTGSCSKVSLEPSLLQAEQPQLPQPVLSPSKGSHRFLFKSVFVFYYQKPGTEACQTSKILSILHGVSFNLAT